MSTKARYAALVAAAVLLAGCGAAGPGAPTGADPGEASSVGVDATDTAPTDGPVATDVPVETTAAPAPETSGPEAPGPTVQKPAILTAGGPNGGGVDDSTQARQCLAITYISGTTIPDPVRLTIVKIALEGPRLFRIGGTGCAGSTLPGCLKHVWTAPSIAAGEGRCAIPLVAVGEGGGPGHEDDEQLVAVTVQLWCGTLKRADCEAFRAAIDADHQQARLTLDPDLYAQLHPGAGSTSDPTPDPTPAVTPAPTAASG